LIYVINKSISVIANISGVMTSVMVATSAADAEP